ncbi:MAG: right-handed parallel beta-helix repeat-containing protein [Terriglobales bacterium]
MVETIRLKRVCLCAALLLGVCFAAQTAYAATYVVGTCKSGTHFTTIQAAVNAATASGPSVIDVCPGSYYEQVTITQSKLTLAGIQIGTEDFAAIYPPAAGLAINGADIFGNQVATQIFVKNASGVTIKNLTVDGTGNNVAPCVPYTMEGIYFQNASGTITNNVVRNQYQTNFAHNGPCQNGLAINVESLTNTSNVTVAHNSVRAYQKNGITATGAATGVETAGPFVLILDNYIVGLAATDMNWKTPGAAENGIQVGFGASGEILQNTINDNIWALDTINDTGDAASGIIIYASSNFTVIHNNVNSSQYGILTESDTADGYGTADHTFISDNDISGTQIFDAIDLCSSGNTAQGNNIFGSAESAIHLDDTCGGTGNNNTVLQNTITEGCAGVLLGTGTGNIVRTNNVYSSVNFTTLAGDACNPPAGPTSKNHKRLRPSPYMPMR